MVRYLLGVRDAAERLAHPERLEERSRSMVRAGGLIPRRALDWERRRQPAVARRLQEVFRTADILLTQVVTRPSLPAGLGGVGALESLLTAGRFVPFPGAWNLTGQPAASVPVGLAASGVPLAVQLVGRPNEEGTLLSLAGQLEAERPWAHLRPPVS
jgi:amidase